MLDIVLNLVVIQKNLLGKKFKLDYLNGGDVIIVIGDSHQNQTGMCIKVCLINISVNIQIVKENM